MSQAAIPPGGRPAPALDDQATRLRALVQGDGAQAARRESRRPSSPPRPRRTRPWTIAVASGKGGVGKTNIALNIGYQLSRRGRSVTLIDGDLGLSNADVLCGVNAGLHLGHVLSGVRELKDVMLDLGAGFRLVPGGSGVARLADLRESERWALIDVLEEIEGRSEIIIVDCGAGIGASVLSLVQASDRALVVTTPEPTAVADAYALVKSATLRAQRRGLRPPLAELVVNQVSNERQARCVHERVDGVCRRFVRHPVGLGGYVRLDPRVADSVRERRAFSVAHPRCHAARDLSAVSDRLLKAYPGARREEPGNDGLVARIVRVMSLGDA